MQQEAPGRVLCLTGEIDVEVVGEYEATHGRAPLPVDAIDAGQVTFISSSGVGFLLRWSRAAAQAGKVAPLRGSSPALDRILRVTGLEEVLHRAARGHFR